MPPADDLSRSISARSRADSTAASRGPSAESDGPTADATPGGGRTAPPADAGRYALDGEIARGGMGVVYRATDSLLGREVAVKVLHNKFAADSPTARRFVDEVRITGQLQHPGIPPVHDFGTLADGRPFLVMKLIKGRTLETRLRDREPVAADHGRFVAVFEQVCQAVAYAHAHGVIHRDLKPSNVMVGAFGEVQVMDWGLAKVLGPDHGEPGQPGETLATEVHSLRESDGQFTQAGSVLGTPAYMPPEQAIGAVDQIDARSDVFGLGGILCAGLTGQPPFVGETSESVRQAAAKGKVADAFARLDSCGADPDLAALCQRCLSPEKEERPVDAGVVARAVADLRAAADERARRAELDRVRVEGEKAMAEARSAERRKRRRVWSVSAAALTLAFIAGLGAVLAVKSRANADLAAKNGELADEREKVQARFELAQEAIETFHTGVSEDVLLQQAEFKELRTKLLAGAARFYGRSEKLLEGQTDPRSRKALAAGYFQLGELTATIGSPSDGLALHRKALAVRRELAASAGDVASRLDVARSLNAIGVLQIKTGNPLEAGAAYEEQRNLTEQLVAEAATDDVRSVLGKCYHKLGLLLMNTGKPEEALKAYQKAVTIRQELADAHPAVPEFQCDLAESLNNIGVMLQWAGKSGEAWVYEEGIGHSSKVGGRQSRRHAVSIRPQRKPPQPRGSAAV
jgi:tRNA A-37 threonylcarbamoyl transferase component Bud32/tetratricopeptide (TPR) repeat protein